MKIAGSVNEKSSMADPPEPIFPVQVTGSSNRRLTSKHVLVAVTVLLAVAFIVAGFVTVFYLFKQSTSENADNMTKIFDMTYTQGRTTIKEHIETNIEEGTVEVKTHSDDDKNDVFYHDHKKGLSLLITNVADVSRCYLYPMDRMNEKNPEVWQKYMSEHPQGVSVNVTQKGKQEIYMTPMKAAIEDTSYLGPKINKLCEGKSTHWMIPARESAIETRQKREIHVLRCACMGNTSCMCIRCLCLVYDDDDEEFSLVAYQRSVG